MAALKSAIKRRNPNHYRAFAAPPVQDAAATIIELDRAVNELGFVGVLANSRTQGVYYDDARYNDLWSALGELDVPLHIHPGIVQIDSRNLLKGRSEIYGAAWS